MYPLGFDDGFEHALNEGIKSSELSEEDKKFLRLEVQLNFPGYALCDGGPVGFFGI